MTKSKRFTFDYRNLDMNYLAKIAERNSTSMAHEIREAIKEHISKYQTLLDKEGEK